LEEAFKLKKEVFGLMSPEVSYTCKQLCEICNILAVFFLKKDEIEKAYDLLRKSEVLSERSEQGKAMTYNNLACYYRRVGKMRVSLDYLTKALKLDNKLVRVDTLADTHLNICAVLSQIDKHDLALNHAMSAVIILQEEMLKLTVNDNKPSNPEL